MVSSVDLHETRPFRTTVISIDWKKIEWETLNRKCCIVRYDLPPKSGDPSTYYSRIHNWYKEQCDEPCYFHSFGPHLYVLFESADQIKDLKDNKLPLNRTIVERWDLKDDFHCLIKVLVSNYFRVSENFVSNANFILRAQNEDNDFILGLEVQIKQDGHQPENILIEDEAFRLRKMLPTELENSQDWSRKLCYGRFYKNQIGVFKQLKPSQAKNNSQKKQGIYIEYHNQKNRASLTYHSLRSLKDLEESRSYLLGSFISKFLPYLNNMGLPFYQKFFEMKSVDTIRGDEIKKSQIPEMGRLIYVVDSRIKPQYFPDNFIDEFCFFANSLLFENTLVFKKKELADLCDGDWVLRLQDYDVKDFSAEDGILKGQPDPKSDFYKIYRNVVKQSININPNTKRYQDSVKKKGIKAWSIEEYLNYSIKDFDPAEYRLRLEVCYNQLILKDVVMHPDNLSLRLPQVKYALGKVFIFKGIILYFDNDSLKICRITNDNLENALNIIQEKTGKDLIDDVLQPAANYSYKKLDDPKTRDALLKKRFIISKEYVLEIIDSKIRVLYDDQEIRRRFEGMEEQLSKHVFYPELPVKGDEPFTEEQLIAYTDFLDKYVYELSISYSDLKFRYGKHIRDENGKIIVKDGGFYQLLGISKDSKLKRFYENWRGIKFESVREQNLVAAYQGIWFSSETQHYMVGAPYTRNIEQERGFVLRGLVCHQGKVTFDELLNNFFPMLELNIIRSRNYTVHPFPYGIIEIWQDIDTWMETSIT